MEAYLPFLLPAVAGVASGGFLAAISDGPRQSSMAQFLAGALGGLGGGIALAPLALDLLGGTIAGAQGGMIGNVLGGALGGGALTILGGSFFGNARR